MRTLGFETLLPDEVQSPIITSFLYPHKGFDFKSFYVQLKEKGFVIYPGRFLRQIHSVSVISVMYIQMILYV